VLLNTNEFQILRQSIYVLFILLHKIYEKRKRREISIENKPCQKIEFQTVRVTWHSTHFQVGGDNPKVEERNLSNLPQGLVEGHFPNDKYSKITQNSRNFHSYCLILIPNLSNLYFKR
jgi:hypothetical protein